MRIRVTHIDTACFLLELGDFRILTDPVLDQPGRLYHFGVGTLSKKYSTPARTADQIGPVDLVLLSHDQHEDNLDQSGRKFLGTVKQVLSTKPASRRIPGVTGLDDWDSIPIDSEKVPGLKITAVPAQHASLRILSPLAGKVIGFILEWKGQNGVYYISGDTVLFKGIHEIAKRYPKIDTAFIHTGCAGFPYLTGPIHYTFHAREAAKAIELLKPRRAIPVHYDGWWHFREPLDRARKQYAESGVGDVVQWLKPGVSTEL